MYKFYLLLLLLSFTDNLKAQKIKLLQKGKATSIRGLSVVNNKTAWISGSKGYVAITSNGGKNWNWQQVKGYEQADFRDIEAFSNKEAIIMSSGTPALILKTTDGGTTWQLKYQNDDKACFLDAMDFDGQKHGLILGDPINNKFLILETTDAGESWHPFSNPPDAMPGEAAFAASGTCLRINDKGTIMIVTGGAAARYLKLDARDTKWDTYNLSITHGTASNGAFSVSNNGLVIVGGDYSKNKKNDATACYLNADLKDIFNLSYKNPSGYQSCVENIKKGILLSTGTPGSNITINGGYTWTQIDTVSFNVCRKAKRGNMVLLAGDKGKIAFFKL